jgi:hypothetical protein
MRRIGTVGIVCLLLIGAFMNSVSTMTITSSAESGEMVAQWKFDEGAGTTVMDSVGSNHGTIMRERIEFRWSG